MSRRANRIATKVIGRYGGRRTRFHLPDGRLLPLRGFLEIPGLLLDRFTGRNKNVPWMTPSAVHYLDGILDPTKTVLELGSGFSTAWYGKRSLKVVTFENDHTWKRLVQSRLDRYRISNVEIRCYPLDDFTREIEKLGNQTFDVVVVDCNEPRPGFRLECALAASPLAKHGGWIVIDDFERLEYAQWHPPELVSSDRRFVGMKPSPLMTVETAFFYCG